jgi:hypothetical protein
MRVGYMAQGSQRTIHLTDADKHPRGQLLKKLDRKHADKMYVDTLEGKAKHIGYIVAGEWFRVYEVHDWEGK